MRMMVERIQGEEEWDLALWLRKGEERCLRVGNLEWRVEKMRVLRIMESMESDKTMRDTPALWTWNVNQEGNPEDLGGRHPTKQPCDVIPTGRKASTNRKDNCDLEAILDDLPAWWSTVTRTAKNDSTEGRTRKANPKLYNLVGLTG
jgi:hypothetical protein